MSGSEFIRGERYHQRLANKAQRQEHKALIEGSNFIPSFPEPLVPEVFFSIHSTYWHCLQQVSDPRHSGMRVYPLDKILHRVLSGFLSGSRPVGILFPKVHPAASKL